MKRKPLQLILFLLMMLTAGLVYGQDSLGPGPKRARTLQDYKPTTLKEIAAVDPKRDTLLPYRVRVVYTGSVRPISRTSDYVLHRWGQCCAGSPDHYTRNYRTEMQFVEGGTSYWSGVQARMLTDFQTELKVGQVIDLFLIRITVRETKSKKGLVLLAERFQPAGADDDQKQMVEWIRNNLPSYAEKDLKVEVTEPCRLKITDSSKSASVSKAVVFLPLADLDPSKVNVTSREHGSAWDLWLHTKAGKRSITFMLYQGGPAEGGQATKHSLTFSGRQKAESMADGFRRAINICTGMKGRK